LRQRFEMHILPHPIHVVQVRDLLPLVASSHDATRTWSDDFVRAIGLSWQLHVLLRSRNTRERHLAPYRCQLSRDSWASFKHRAGPSSRSPACRYQCWRYYFALGVQRRQLPVQRSPSDWPHNRIAILQRDPVSLPIYERTTSIWYYSIDHTSPSSSPTATASSLRGHPNRQTFSFHRRLLRLWLCVLVLPTHSVTHALRIGAGRSMVQSGLGPIGETGPPPLPRDSPSCSKIEANITSYSACRPYRIPRRPAF
jgi:hypothetical protein